MSEATIPTREQKLKSLRSRLQQLEVSAKELNNEFWWRSHSAILANRGGKATLIALTDTYTLKRGHCGYGDGDPALESATTRHVLGTGPSKIATMLAYLYDLYPELSDFSDLTPIKKDGSVCGS
jgi:hypothetical protein